MREAEKKETYEAAIELYVSDAVAKAQPEHPVLYARKVREDLTERHRDNARNLFAEYGELTAEELRGLLYDIDHPTAPSPAPTVRYFTDRDECPTCGGRGGGGWLNCAGRDDLGMTPDLVPCPTCAMERHRLHETRTQVEREDRADEIERYATAVAALRGEDQ